MNGLLMKKPIKPLSPNSNKTKSLIRKISLIVVSGLGDGEEKLLVMEAFSLIFKIFWNLEKLSANLRLIHIINTPKLSHNR